MGSLRPAKLIPRVTSDEGRMLRIRPTTSPRKTTWARIEIPKDGEKPSPFLLGVEIMSHARSPQNIGEPPPWPQKSTLSANDGVLEAERRGNAHIRLGSKNRPSGAVGDRPEGRG